MLSVRVCVSMLVCVCMCVCLCVCVLCMTMCVYVCVCTPHLIFFSLKYILFLCAGSERLVCARGRIAEEALWYAARLLAAANGGPHQFGTCHRRVLAQFGVEGNRCHHSYDIYAYMYTLLLRMVGSYFGVEGNRCHLSWLICTCTWSFFNNIALIAYKSSLIHA